MADKKYYVGDTPLIKIDCVSDVTAAVNPKIIYTRPDGVTGEWDADIVGGQYFTYQCITDDIPDDSDGDWKFQTHMTLGVWTGHGETDIQKISALGE